MRHRPYETKPKKTVTWNTEHDKRHTQDMAGHGCFFLGKRVTLNISCWCGERKWAFQVGVGCLCPSGVWGTRSANRQKVGWWSDRYDFTPLTVRFNTLNAAQVLLRFYKSRQIVFGSGQRCGWYHLGWKRDTVIKIHTGSFWEHSVWWSRSSLVILETWTLASVRGTMNLVKHSKTIVKECLLYDCL